MDLDQSMQQKHDGLSHLNLIKKIDSNLENVIIEDWNFFLSEERYLRARG